MYGMSILSQAPVWIFSYTRRSAHNGGSSSLFSSTTFTVPEPVAAVSYVMIFVPYWTNPLIYVLSNSSYRQAYTVLLCRWRRRRRKRCHFHRDDRAKPTGAPAQGGIRSPSEDHGRCHCYYKNYRLSLRRTRADATTMTIPDPVVMRGIELSNYVTCRLPQSSVTWATIRHEHSLPPPSSFFGGGRGYSLPCPLHRDVY